jgi:apolipoprotein N-acyltransferase
MRRVIHWVVSQRFALIRFSRWILAVCAFALVGIAQLPHNPLDRILAIIGIAVIGLVFLVWLAVALVMILRPRLFERVGNSGVNPTPTVANSAAASD